jgi:predicted acetyltransferase
MAYAFRPSPPLPKLEEWKASYFTEATGLALFADNQPMACAAYSLMPQNVRGKIYPNAGVWGVTTHPAGRRSGYARQLLTQLLQTIHEADMAFSTLYPFRESFYDRLGYTTFPHPRVATIPTSTFQPLLKTRLEGHVERLSIAEGFESYRTYLRKQLSKIHGMSLASDLSAEETKTSDSVWLAVALIDNEPHGMMTYSIKGNGDNMLVPTFHYDDSQGKYLLLEWFARHIDQVKEIELRLKPWEVLETWLPDVDFTISLRDAPMARLLNIHKIDGMQSGPGSFSAQISDPQCPWNNGRYLFETSDGILHVSPTQQAQCELTIQGITALLYGTHDPETFAIRGWGNPSPELQVTMRTMFPAKLPYLFERF